jgi:hypothetical protein
MMSWPPWDDEKAVSQRVIVELAKQPDEDDSHIAEDDEPWRPSWNSGAARWREQAFARAKRGDFDLLTQYVAFAHLGDATLDERKVLVGIINGKIRRKAGHPKELFPVIPNDRVNLVRLMWCAEEVRRLLVLHYKHRKGILQRAIKIAGEQVNWYGKPARAADVMREKALAEFRRPKSRRARL